MQSFNQKFSQFRDREKTLLCIGLDPDKSKIPPAYTTLLAQDERGREFFSLKKRGDYQKKEVLSRPNHERASFSQDANPDCLASYHFLLDAIDHTASYALAYKLNLAFYESWHDNGIKLLLLIMQYIRENFPQHIIILDGKRGDIANTTQFYGDAYLPYCDAMTVNPYMGVEPLSAYFSHLNKALMILCLTSNPGAAQFQLHGNPPLYLHVAQQIAKLAEQTTMDLWLVVGATQQKKYLQTLRQSLPNMHFLLPGLGKEQGGSLAQCVQIFGKQALYHFGREILYPDCPFDELPEKRAEICKNLLNLLIF